MYEANLSNSGHTRRFQIKPLDAAGWEVREEEDSRLVSARVYNDWHRVERARSAFQIAVLTLKQDGWDHRAVTIRRTQGAAVPPCRGAAVRCWSAWVLRCLARSALFNEPVAQAHHGFDLLSHGSELAAQPADVDIH